MMSQNETHKEKMKRKKMERNQKYNKNVVLQKITPVAIDNINKQMFNTFGCEISNDFLNKSQKKIMKKIGLGNVLRVPRRKKGMTSSGVGGCCHSNVNKLVELYGGQQLLGYVVMTNVGFMGRSCLQVMWHSVWVSPESKLVDITKSSNPNNDYTHFLPVTLYNNDNIWTHGMDMMFPENWEDIGYCVQGDISHPEDEGRHPSQLEWLGTIGSMDTGKFPDPMKDPTSGFTKPSLITGKTYNETNQSIRKEKGYRNQINPFTHFDI